MHLTKKYDPIPVSGEAQAHIIRVGRFNKPFRDPYDDRLRRTRRTLRTPRTNL